MEYGVHHGDAQLTGLQQLGLLAQKGIGQPMPVTFKFLAILIPYLYDHEVG